MYARWWTFLSISKTTNEKDKGVNMKNGLENLLQKAVEMYQYNLEQYPEENPTMIGAIEEILYEIEKE